MTNEISLLKRLVEIPSISGEEKKIAKFVFSYLKKHKLKPKMIGNNVYCAIGKGRTILFNTHLDTVPPNGWTMDPFKAKQKNGKVYGLGSNDAKASLASMLTTVTNIDKNKLNGRVIFAATCKEEVGGELEKLVLRLPKIDAAIVGEPTHLKACIAQKGLLVLKLISKGKSAHAAHAGSKGKNAILGMCEDIKKLQRLKFKKHKVLGYPVITVTAINAGIRKNVIPDRCEAILDIRTTPSYTREKLIGMVKRSVNSDVDVMSKRLVSKHTPEESKIAKAAKKCCKLAGSATTSDWVFLNVPTIKIGPGKSTVSHTPNEYVEISQVRKAVKVYEKIFLEYLA